MVEGGRTEAGEGEAMDHCSGCVKFFIKNTCWISKEIKRKSVSNCLTRFVSVIPFLSNAWNEVVEKYNCWALFSVFFFSLLLFPRPILVLSVFLSSETFYLMPCVASGPAFVPLSASGCSSFPCRPPDYFCAEKCNISRFIFWRSCPCTLMYCHVNFSSFHFYSYSLYTLKTSYAHTHT